MTTCVLMVSIVFVLTLVLPLGNLISIMLTDVVPTDLMTPRELFELLFQQLSPSMTLEQVSVVRDGADRETIVFGFLCCAHATACNLADEERSRTVIPAEAARRV